MAQIKSANCKELPRTRHLAFESLEFRQLLTRVLWDVADGGNGHAYEAVQSFATWNAARSAAQAAGGHLVTISSSAENDFVFQLVNKPSFWTDYGSTCCSWGPWLGGFQPGGSAEPAGGWRWVTDEPFSYTHWRTQEPNDSGDENALQFFSAPPGARARTWNDEAGNVPMPGYVIEYDGPECNPGEHVDDVVLSEVVLDMLKIKEAQLQLRFGELRYPRTFGQRRGADNALHRRSEPWVLRSRM